MSHVQLYIYLGDIGDALLKNIHYNTNDSCAYFVGENLNIDSDFIKTIEWGIFRK